MPPLLTGTFTRTTLVALACGTALAGTPALAQAVAPPPAAAQTDAPPAQPPAAEDDPVDEIVVTAQRLRGQVQTDSAPIAELDAADVASYGASSLEDLIAQLSPQVGAGRGRGGRPVFLINGQRVSNFREMGRFPPEAVKKIEILPEAVATKFGFPPDQRVINIILKDTFASKELELEYAQPTRGGFSRQDAEASLMRIAGPSRLNASVEYKRSTPLTEAERNIVQAAGSVPGVTGDPDPAAYRTLVSRSSSLEADITRTTNLGADGTGGQFTLNGQYLHQITNGWSGLDTVLLTDPAGRSVLRALDADPLDRRTRSDTFSLGASLAKPLGDWQLSATLDASRGITHTETDERRDASALIAAAAAGSLALDGALPPVGRGQPAVSDSKTYTIDTLATLTGNPFKLPAGEADLTLSGGYKMNGITSSDTRSTDGNISLNRRRGSAGVAFNLPITSTREGFGAAIGDLSLDLSGGIDTLSDFGTLWNATTGLTWRPTERLNLQASYVFSQVAPTLTQLGAAQITGFNVATYDFRTGQTVLVNTLGGGNPNLRAETQRDIKLSANYDLKLAERSNLVVEYYRNRSRDVTASFPLLTTAIEAAFPDRVTRAADGTLLSVDQRPVTFARQDSDRLRYGINIFGKVGKPAPQGDGGRNREAPAGGAAVTPSTPPAAPAGTGAPGGFDPARFAELRAKFCATPEGQSPDLSGLPEQMAARLKGADGQIDPAKVTAARARICSADGAPPRAFDPARFAALRTALACQDADKAPDLAALPPEIVARLKGPDGTVPPERLQQLKTRICAIPQPAPNGSGQPAGGGTGGRPGGVGGGMGMFGPGGDGQGRWNLALYHSINLANRITIAPGVPELDLLRGDAIGSTGGVARHSFELQAGLFWKGIGTRLSGNYSTGTTVKGSGLPGSSDLHFGGLATFDLRLFMALDQQKWLTGGNADGSFWKGARLSLRVNNLFDAQQRVTDANGDVPLRYQPGLIDPTGRVVAVEFRKVF